MKIWIPNCGDAAVLDADWTFHLHSEHRNYDFSKIVKKSSPGSYTCGDEFDVTLPKGTEIVFDRIYIRQDNSNYASVTFIIKSHSNHDFVGERFWAKLKDVNSIDARLTTTGNPVGGFAKAKYKSALKQSIDPVAAQKAADRKVSAAELEAARNACSEAVEATRYGRSASHVDLIIQRAARESGYDRHGSWMLTQIRQRMTFASSPKSPAWSCESTSVDPITGAKTRKMRFSFYGKRYGGYEVTSIGTEVIAMSLLI